MDGKNMKCHTRAAAAPAHKKSPLEGKLIFTPNNGVTTQKVGIKGSKFNDEGKFYQKMVH